ncbi:hypothetical protein [Halobacteriovorax sp. HLS]|uniref:hypothetical protein n=1 Tax=Halobacteriovorax sp. HLS TaxID=2234000 RepID=UPI000FD953A6|nr:hypothetical protein [Halobacteriovorax sp. HLS]
MSNLSKKFIFLLSPIFFVSCNSSDSKGRFSAGQCVGEQATNYASYVKQKGPVYKIESIEEGKYKISIWYNHKWLYQGARSFNYFNDRKTFVYKGMNCPDGRSKASITDKIKGIEL